MRRGWDERVPKSREESHLRCARFLEEEEVQGDNFGIDAAEFNLGGMDRYDSPLGTNHGSRLVHQFRELDVSSQATSSTLDDPLEEVIESAERQGRRSLLVSSVVQKLQMYLDHGKGILNFLSDLKEALQTLKNPELNNFCS